MVSARVFSSALLVSVALAQAPNATFSETDVQTVLGLEDSTTRASWCTGQRTNCGILCGGQAETDSNRCDGSDLNFTCTCSSNSSSPALEFYVDTIPYYECVSLRGNCFATNANDLASQEACNSTYVCGDVNVNEATVDSGDSESSDDSGDDSGSSEDSGDSTASPTNSAVSETASAEASETPNAALKVGEKYGAGILSVALFAAMSLVF